MYDCRKMGFPRDAGCHYNTHSTQRGLAHGPYDVSKRAHGLSSYLVIPWSRIYRADQPQAGWLTPTPTTRMLHNTVQPRHEAQYSGSSTSALHNTVEALRRGQYDTSSTYLGPIFEHAQCQDTRLNDTQTKTRRYPSAKHTWAHS